MGRDRGTWGGIVLLGRAINNQGFEINYNALDWAKYGGSNPNDSSGVLTYVRIDGPGFAIAVDRELNGLTLAAVGRRTVMHHIQVNRGDDDGIEWFGGTVNADHLVVTNPVDDNFDMDHGFSGNIDYMIGIQQIEPARIRTGGSSIPSETVGDRVIECGSSYLDDFPITMPHFSHVTLIDNGRSGGVFEAKEGCGGTYEKMVMVAGGANLDSPSNWGVHVDGFSAADNLIAPTPLLDFKDVFFTGRWISPFSVAASQAQIDQVTQILNQKIKSYPYETTQSFGLYKDLSPSNPDVIAAQAGAIVDGDLWYKGWTLPGTMDFPLGDEKIQYLHTQPAGGRDSASAVKLYRPLSWDFAIFQSAPLNGALNIPACQAFLDGLDQSSVLLSGLLPFPTILANGDRLYKALGQSGKVFGPVGIHKLRLKLVLLTGQVIDETMYWETVQ
jgi:hypothetical protein